MSVWVLLLSLLWSLVEVHSQTFPRLSFMSQTLANHSYVDLSQVGRPEFDGSEGVQCITDLVTCCSSEQGPHRGDWYFPDGTRLPHPASDVDTFETREAQRVDIRRNSGANSPTGIYRCEIPTNAVHDGTDTSVRDTVYVGLYTANGGDVEISGEMEFSEALRGPSPQFTLACISTGGPATTVTWTRDSTTVTQGTETVLNDPVTAQYTHTLTVTGRLPGLYTCTVANNKPSNALVMRAFTLEAPTNAPEMFKAVAGERHVVFSWSPHVTDLHGAIDNYTLSCSPSPSSLPQSPSSQSGSLTATGFSPNTLYFCSLTANNLWGSGPPARANLSYTYFQLRLKGGLPCTEVIATLTEQKLDDVRAAVLEQLEASCAEGASENINRQSFSCFEESPSFLTYRARLEGTSATDSGSLVSLIEAWVRGGGAIVIVTGVLMTIDANCSVAISSLSEPECSPPTTTSPTPHIISTFTISSTQSCACAENTPAIIGGAVAIAIALITAATIIAIVALVLKNRPHTIKKASMEGTTIHTATNTAYGTTKRKPERIGGAPTISSSSDIGPIEEEKMYEMISVEEK